MKKIATLAFISFFAAAAFSQTSKNNWLAGGSIGFTSSKEHDNSSPTPDFKTSVFQIAPDFGYFFINNMAGGLSVQYTSASTSENGNSSTASSFSAGPFVRYYFSLSSHVKILVHGNMAWGSQKYVEDQPSESLTSFGFKAGPAFFLNQHVALEITAGYQSMKTKGDNTNYTTTDFMIGAGFQIHLGASKK